MVVRKVITNFIRYLAIGLGLIIVLVLMLVRVIIFFPILAFLGYAAPFWSFLISGHTALWLFKSHELRTHLYIRGLGIAVWLSAYVGALRFDILKMYELYAALPTEPSQLLYCHRCCKRTPSIRRLTKNKIEKWKKYAG